MSWETGAETASKHRTLADDFVNQNSAAAAYQHRIVRSTAQPIVTA